MSEKNIEEVEMSAEENKGMMLVNSDDILAGLLEAASYGDENSEESALIQIARKKKTVIEFRIHALSEEQYNNCRKKYTTYKRNKQLGIKYADETNTSKYRSALIYEATVKEDREKVWDNKQAWKKLDCINAIDLIEKVLKAGEKDAVIDKIDEMSGYTSSVVEETAKN